MVSRVGLAASIVLLTVVALASAARQPPSGTAMYVVRVDPRLCPSPMCGGYWVALANGSRTRCQDGLRHPRCYVATAARSGGRPLGGIAEGALVRGAIDDGRDDFGVLIVSAVYAPAGTRPVKGGFYRIVDNGVRCVRAPCFSFTFRQVNGRTRGQVSGVDLDAARAEPSEVARAQAALRTKDGLYAQGTFRSGLDGGRVLHTTRFFLRAPLPRA